MLTKNECLSILVGLENENVNVNAQLKKVLLAQDIPTDVLKFIVENKGFEAVAFYELLRKKHNQSKSPLYTNLLSDPDSVDTALTTLSCLLVQIILYNNKLPVEKRTQFLSEIRVAEITEVLADYFKTENNEMLFKLLKAIQIDLMTLEYLNNKRELKETE